MIDRITKARAYLLKALDDQHDLVLRDLPMRTLTVDELATLSVPEAVLEAMRERQRQEEPGDHEAPPPGV